MKKRLIVMIAILLRIVMSAAIIYGLYLFVMSSPFVSINERSVIKTLNLPDKNSNDYTELTKMDTRGSHGDGNQYIELVLNDKAAEQLEAKITEEMKKDTYEQNTNWNQHPLNADVDALLYDGKIGESAFHYDFAKKAGIPYPTDGYYHFKDLYQQDKTTNLLSRGSHDFRYAYYDIETKRLYYLEAHT